MQEELYNSEKPDDFIHIDISESQAIDLILASFEGQGGTSSNTVLNN
jgi:hypothetical protein